MNILVTGGTGFLGKALTKTFLEKSYRVYSLSRHPPEPAENLIPLEGDILLPNLGLENVPEDIDAVIHSAALLSFKPGDKGRLYETNWHGTENVVQWMKKHGIGRLYHVSTAYLFGQNHYEISKKLAEQAITRFPTIETTIIRPSIIIGDSKVEGIPPTTGFYAVIGILSRIKNWVEKKAQLPPLKIELRIRGNPSGELNLIPVDVVAKEVVNLIDGGKSGIFYLTHPKPLRLATILKYVSEAIGAEIRILPNFTPNLAERLIALSLKEMAPYLSGDKFPSSITCQPLDKQFIIESVKAYLRCK